MFSWQFASATSMQVHTAHTRIITMISWIAPGYKHRLNTKYLGGSPLGASALLEICQQKGAKLPERPNMSTVLKRDIKDVPRLRLAQFKRRIFSYMLQHLEIRIYFSARGRHLSPCCRTQFDWTPSYLPIESPSSPSLNDNSSFLLTC